MAQYVIPIRDEELKQEIEAAFASQFLNAEGLDAEQLVVKHVSNHIRRVLNEARLAEAKALAAEVASLEESLE